MTSFQVVKAITVAVVFLMPSLLFAEQIDKDAVRSIVQKLKNNINDEKKTLQQLRLIQKIYRAKKDGKITTQQANQITIQPLKKSAANLQQFGIIDSSEMQFIQTSPSITVNKIEDKQKEINNSTVLNSKRKTSHSNREKPRANEPKREKKAGVTNRYQGEERSRAKQENEGVHRCCEFLA